MMASLITVAEIERKKKKKKMTTEGNKTVRQTRSSRTFT